MLIRIAWRNLFRHRARTTIALAAVAFGVIGLVLTGGFIADILLQLGEAVIHSQSGHLQVAKAGYFAEGIRKPEQYLIDDPARIEATIAKIPAVDRVMARMRFSGVLNNGRSDLAVTVEGVEPAGEAHLGTYLKVVAGRRLSERDRFGVMLGEGVARSLRLAPGDAATLITSTLEGAMNTLDLEVVGLFATFSKDYDARAILIPLPAAQDVIGTHGANTIVVALHRTVDTQDAADALRMIVTGIGLEVWTWQELNDFYDKAVKLYTRQFGVLVLIVLVMVFLAVVNSVNMAVMERIAEFGTMRALGNRNSRIVLLVLTESALLAAVGAGIGTALGLIAANAVSFVGIAMPPPPNSDLPYVARIDLSPSLIAKSFLFCLAATLLAGMIAALRVRRIALVDALRQGV